MTKRSNSKLTAFVVALLTLAALVVPLTGTAAANHPASTCLDVDIIESGTGDELESETATVGETVEVRATLREKPAQPAANDACNGTAKDVPANNGPVNIDFRVEGPNDPNPLNTSGTPDYSCDIQENDSSCSIILTGGQTGDDLVRGWVDHDKIQSTVEADDTEGVNDVTTPGEGDMCSTPAPPAEPDCTDVVEITWEAGEPAAVDCDDSGPPNSEREVNPSNEGERSNEVYTCTVTDARGNPVEANTAVYGEVENGVNDPDEPDSASHSSPDYGCMTDDGPDDDGQCTITVTQNEGEIGTAEICFWVGTPAEGGDAAHCGNEPTEEPEAENSDGTDRGNDEADQVEKTWETRRATAVDAEPESDTNSPGQDHTITATVYDQFGQTFRGSTKVGFEFFQGSPSDTDGNTPANADLTCTTADSNTCSVTYTSQTAGTDLVCVYPEYTDTQQRPVMSGNNTNGTCDGEGLTDADDDPAAADAPERDENDRVSDDQDVVQKRWADPGTATRLDCNPETDTNPTGTGHTITCTARNQANNVVGGVNVDAEATGANDPDANSDTTSPDFSCTTDDNGNCSFTHGTGGTGTTSQPGTTTYRAWIDQDNNNTVAEADNTEGRDETSNPGNEGEPDNTDVVTKAWVGDARRINCEPETATNATGTTHTVTCTVTDTQGTPTPNESVTFTETGAGDISGSSTDTTDQNGQATVTTTSNQAGEQTITGTLTDDIGSDEPNNIDECDRAANDPQGAPAGECSDSVNKTWTQSRPQCSDGVDNDNDNQIDFPNDRGCSSADDSTEAPDPPTNECADGLDNDGDGNTDFPDDTGCSSEADASESGPVLTSGPCAGFNESSSTPRTGGGSVIVGTDGPDDLRGTGGDDLICALGGRDAVRGAGGDDTIYGGGGHDDIRGNAGNDTLYGQAGLDVMRGGHGSDVVRGGGQDDTMRGYTGNDRMWGGGGNDTLRAGDGRDVLRGNNGDDLLDGGGGRDRCRGGAGRDRSFRCER